jgi:hypothetical protein
LPGLSDKTNEGRKTRAGEGNTTNEMNIIYNNQIGGYNINKGRIYC